MVRKINLTRILDTMKQLFPDEYDFYPRTWFLPQQYYEFCGEVRASHEKGRHRRTFIVKPDEGSQGDGIYLLRDPNDYIVTERNHVVQEYLNRPFLLDRLKFDFRVYVILTSVDPLEIWICKDGLARFCTVPYHEPTTKNLHQVYMHLTNYSLNKRSSTFVHTDNDEDGSKRTLISVLNQLERMGYSGRKVFEDIEQVIVKTLIAIAPELKIEYQAEIPHGRAGPSCFQVSSFMILNFIS